MPEQAPPPQTRSYNIDPSVAESMAGVEQPYRDEAYAAEQALAHPPAPARRLEDGALIATGFDPLPLKYAAQVNRGRADQASDAYALGQGGPTEVLTISDAQKMAADPRARQLMRELIEKS
ncbi:MAG TPA: hypothetical protein VIJ68_04530 [Candidatus Saccharimonadales bacterium]